MRDQTTWLTPEEKCQAPSPGPPLPRARHQCHQPAILENVKNEKINLFIDEKINLVFETFVLHQNRVSKDKK